MSGFLKAFPDHSDRFCTASDANLLSFGIANGFEFEHVLKAHDKLAVFLLFCHEAMFFAPFSNLQSFLHFGEQFGMLVPKKRGELRLLVDCFHGVLKFGIGFCDKLKVSIGVGD